jgi:hypothetical protein
MDKETFLNLCAVPPTVEPVETPQGHFYIRMMTVGQRDKFAEEHDPNPNRNFRLRMLTATVCDEEGRLLFTTKDYPRLAEIPSNVVEPIVNAAIKLHRMTPEDVEDVRKKSESLDDDDSSARREPLDSPHVNSRPPSRALS